MIDDTRVVHEARYSHPPERVWQALTEPAELAAWLMPNDFVAREGARFRLDARPDWDEPFDCEVLEIDPPRLLRARWVLGGHPTIVTIELRAEGTDTVLRVEHEDLPPERQSSFDNGWGGKLATDLVLVLDGARAPAGAATTVDGLVAHPALSPSRDH